jgi:hypothetical protein
LYIVALEIFAKNRWKKIIIEFVFDLFPFVIFSLNPWSATTVRVNSHLVRQNQTWGFHGHSAHDLLGPAGAGARCGA